MTIVKAASTLTPEEWNAAYFLGLESIFQRDCECNVPEQVLEGVHTLSAAGYRFRHFAPDRERAVDGYRTPDGVHTRPCQEIADGSFDMVPRARDAVRWLSTHVPQIGTQWLTGLIGAYDQLHPELAQGIPAGQATKDSPGQPPRNPVPQVGGPHA